MSRPKNKKTMGIWGTIGTLVLVAAFYAFEHWQKSKGGGSGSSGSESSRGNGGSARPPSDAPRSTRTQPDNAAILRMLSQRAHEKWVEGASIVVKVLRDDLDGDRHQKFLLRISNDDRVLVAHNIDLAPRVPLRAGDLVSYRGKYVWSEKGGVLHWTHHDPRRPGKGGWLRHEGKVYE